MTGVRRLMAYLRGVFTQLKRYLWTCDFKDFRLIIEQAGQLRYFAVSGRVQRLCVRGLLLCLMATAMLLLALTGYNRLLALDNEALKEAQSREEAAKRRVWELLSVATSIEVDQIADMESHEIERMSDAIMDREKELLKLLRYAAQDLETANHNLQLVLRVTGLNKSQLEALRKELPTPKAPSGGLPNLSLLAEIDASLASRLHHQVELNEQLKGVYELLPSSIPLAQGERTSPFGMRVHPLTRTVEMHEGLDFAPGPVREVTATADGQVIEASYRRGYGNTVKLSHAGGVTTLYAHLSQILVDPGATVRKGQSIGIVGNTGSSTGTHLHYEISVNGQKINPLVAMLVKPNVP